MIFYSEMQSLKGIDKYSFSHFSHFIVITLYNIFEKMRLRINKNKFYQKYVIMILEEVYVRIISSASLIQEKNINENQFFDNNCFMKYNYINNNENMIQSIYNLKDFNNVVEVFKNNELIAINKLKNIYESKSIEILKNINKFNKKLKNGIIYSNENFNICSYISSLTINFFDLFGENLYEILNKNNTVVQFENFIKEHISLILKKRYLNFNDCFIDCCISFSSIITVKIRFIDFSFESLKSGFEIYSGLNKLCKKDPNVFSRDCAKYIEIELSKILN